MKLTMSHTINHEYYYYYYYCHTIIVYFYNTFGSFGVLFGCYLILLTATVHCVFTMNRADSNRFRAKCSHNMPSICIWLPWNIYFSLYFVSMEPWMMEVHLICSKHIQISWNGNVMPHSADLSAQWITYMCNNFFGLNPNRYWFGCWSAIKF